MSSSTSKKPAIRPRWTMRGHTGWVDGIVHLPGGRRIITCSHDASLRLWDLESRAQIGEDCCKRKTLVAILHPGPKYRLEQKASQGNPGIERTPRSSLSDKSFLEVDATRCHDELGGHVDEYPPRFFDSMEAECPPSFLCKCTPRSHFLVPPPPSIRQC
ncbi:hypothetical protein DEU56DRAFT_982944 [Suillus clintonianus]|uniref:uncharacterized protein n=1 Tax=Suillus clintonianus TaxID=1904413 RepID=UPI001B881A60|nr:uncharacterized protein DEU56DRAFT_982944 [Suillus clintonianus]KAG2126556.1 hypothetical protein DEU56DRAFT_982944 [Suillus clintonianus]